MSKFYKALVQERADLVKKHQAISDAAGSRQPVGLSAEETVQSNEILARLDALAPQIAAEEKRREYERTVAALPDGPGAITDVTDREAERGFSSMGEQLAAVIQSKTTGNTDRRLTAINEKQLKIMGATGMHEAGFAEGGAFLQPQYDNNLMERTYQTGKVLSRIPEQPIAANASAYSALLIKETSRATGSRYGGLRVYRVGEGGSITASRPEFERKEIKPHKLAALCYLTDELVRDATALQGHVERLFPLEASFVMENELFSGTGSGQSMGVLNANATISVAKETGQAAASVVAKNFQKMWARYWAAARGNAVWYVDQSVESVLDDLYIPAGTSGFSPGFITVGPDGSYRIKGAPVVPVEYCSALGTVGDVVLADFTQYLGVSKGGLKTDSSIHVAFTTDELALRFVWNFAAEPMWRSALTPANSGSTLSPFITLATRA